MLQTMQLDVPSQPQHCSFVLIRTMCSL